MLLRQIVHQRLRLVQAPVLRVLQQVGDAQGMDALAGLLAQDLHGELDHQGDQGKGSGCGAGLHLVQSVLHLLLGQPHEGVQGVLHLLLGQPHEGVVQHRGQHLQLGVRHLVGHTDQLVLHHAAVRHHHGDEGVVLHHQQIVPLHRHPIFGGRGGEHRVVADLGEDFARPVDDPVQLLHLYVQRVVDALGLLHGQPVLAHELIDVQPVAQRGGDPPR